MQFLNSLNKCFIRHDKRYYSSQYNKPKSIFSYFYFSYDPELIKSKCDELWSKLDKDQTYMFLVKADCTRDGIICLNRQIFLTPSKDSVELLVSNIIIGMEQKLLNYEIEIGNDMIICYRKHSPIPNSKVKNNVNSNIRPETRRAGDTRASFLRSTYYPESVKEEDYGLKFKSENVNGKTVTHFKYRDSVIIKRTKISNTEYHCTVHHHGVEVAKFVDIIAEDKTWSRKINNILICYDSSNNIIGHEVVFTSDFIEELEEPKSRDKKFVTIDIETYLDTDPADPNKKVFVPYAIGVYDGEESEIFYLTDYDSPKLMMEAFIALLSSKKYQNQLIFAHNFSNFDSAFLLHYLADSFVVNPIVKDGKVISVNIKSKPAMSSSTYSSEKNKPVNLTIRDSYLLIPFSLTAAGKLLSLDILKTKFPYIFVNPQTMNYVGKTPDSSFFNDISEEEYNKNVKEDWSTKDETKKYLDNDLKVLYELLLKFRNFLKDKLNLDPLSCVSLSNYAMKLFRTHFFDKAKGKIPNLKRFPHDFIRQAFFGGIVDVIKPLIENGYFYDINSLYPFCMKFMMPTGLPKFVSYKSGTPLTNQFGFFKVKVTTPEDLDIPVLPFRTDTHSVINGIGSWIGTYFSEELKSAVNDFGYMVELIEGFEFVADDSIFSDFVDTLNKLKTSDIGEFRKIIKLILNGLYGRFAMRDLLNKTVIVSEIEANEIFSVYPVINIIELGEMLMITYIDEVNKNICNQSNADYVTYKLNKDHSEFNNISIAISCAVAAYGRILMNKFKTIPNNPCVYTDTDSIVLEKPLDSMYVDTKKLGLFKLEHKIKYGIFINPKTYYLETQDGEVVIKIKGLKNSKSMTYADFINLSMGIPVEKINTKWIKSYGKGTVQINESNMLIVRNSNKRRLIIKDGVWVGTAPYKINSNQINKHE